MTAEVGHCLVSQININVLSDAYERRRRRGTSGSHRIGQQRLGAVGVLHVHVDGTVAADAANVEDGESGTSSPTQGLSLIHI